MVHVAHFLDVKHSFARVDSSRVVLARRGSARGVVSSSRDARFGA